jgi:hypothetical protein
MALSIKSKRNLLIDRIENNFHCFQISLSGMSRSKLIENAGRIVAVTEAYEMLTKEYAWDEEGEIDFYLMFRDPLTIVADFWESRRDEMTVDFDAAMFDVAYSDKILPEYPLIDGVDSSYYNKIMSFNCY